MHSQSESEIKTIIHKIANQDDQIAFRQFFDIYYHRLLNFAFYFLESSVAAEEVVSTVFISLRMIGKQIHTLPKCTVRLIYCRILFNPT